MYIPLNYDKINAAAGLYNPSPVKSYNNASFTFWQRSLYQRALSVIELSLPDVWAGSRRDFISYVLYRCGYMAVFEHPIYGYSIQPCTLSGYDFYYQPTRAIVTNPALRQSLELEIGKDCEILKLTPDYAGAFDVIDRYAAILAEMDSAVNMSIINSKIAYLLMAKTKAAAEALKKVMDKVNHGEPTIVFDQKLMVDPVDKDSPFHFMERTAIKNGYITTDLLQDLQTILSCFDAEIGIPTIPYHKKERMVTSEADSRQIDSAARSTVWVNTLNETAAEINKLFPYEQPISAKLRYSTEEEEDVNN